MITYARLLNKVFLVNANQLCINSYRGKHGRVKKVLDTTEEYRRDNVEITFGHMENENSLYIIFRGTDSFSDWLDNLKFWQVKTLLFKKTQYCHTGFIEQFEKVQNKIIDKLLYTIKEQQHLGKINIYVMGHSLGGALATICACAIKDLFGETNNIEVNCITFGSPRVGNRKFVEYFNRLVNNSIRIINGSDIVTRVPMIWLFYKHVDNELQIYKKGWFKNLFSSTYDHEPEKSYLKNLKKLKKIKLS